MNTPITLSNCPACRGTGKVEPRIAKARRLRNLRLALCGRFSLRAVARAMSVSPAYLCQMEYGQRAIPAHQENAILRAVKKLTK